MRGAASKSFFTAIQSSREQVAPQADAALAATKKTWIVMTLTSMKAVIHQAYGAPEAVLSVQTVN